MGIDRPHFYKLDARVWVRDLSRAERRPVRLDSLPSRALDTLADVGFRWICLSSLWETGLASRELHSRRARSLEEMREALPDLELSDIDGAPYAVTSYRVREDLGGDEALEALRMDLARRELRLAVELDPSRVGLDHPWTLGHPEFFVRGAEPVGRALPPPSYRTPAGLSLALAVDGDGSAVPDALQLNYRHAGLRRAMIAELAAAAEDADGIWIRNADRLDSARIASLWGDASLPADGSTPVEAGFLGEALPALRAAAGWVLVVVDGTEIEENDGGADLLLDRRLRELLVAGDTVALRRHLLESRRPPGAAGERGARAYINALEPDCVPRAALSFSSEAYSAATLLASLAPGGLLIADGQIDGRKIPLDSRLSRRAAEPRDRDCEAFHASLFEILARPEVVGGSVEIVGVREAWEGNVTWRNVVAFLYRGARGESLLAAINYGPAQSQCYVDLSALEARGHEWNFQDLLSLAVYRRDGADLDARGLYLDLAAWDYNVFEIARGAPL